MRRRSSGVILFCGTSLAALLGPAATAFAAESSKPAGGAAASEVIGATTGALIATAVVFALGIGHRTGRLSILRRLGAYSERVSGLPPWAALPTAIAAVSLIIALFGMYWDISLHIDQGRDPGPLANPAHYFILVGLFGIFVAGFFAIVLPEGKPSPAAVKISDDWYAPVGGVVFMACASFALLGFPLDDMWHRLFGQDVTLWGPTHLMMFGGAGLSLLGHATLVAEAGENKSKMTARGPLGFIIRNRKASIFGGLLIGLSTFQGEFDFGVPQFQLVFQPVLIALAAAVALVGARIYIGRGGALAAAANFIVIRGVIALLVGPVAGEATPHMPLYLAEAALVELVALRVSPDRPYRFGAWAGALIGTVGLAAEWGWSHVWMPIPWPSSMLGEAVVLTPIAAVAGALLGGFVGTALALPRRPRALRVPSPVPAVAALAALGAVVAFGLFTHTDRGLRAQVALHQVSPPPHRSAQATVRLRPRDAADHAKWLTATAWQGGGLRVNRLERVGEGVYRTTQPLPLYGDWKALIRLHSGNSIAGLPVYLPADRAIPVEGVPAPTRFERTFVADKNILQRERKKGVAGWLFPAAGGLVLLIALALVSTLGWALTRVARVASEDAPPPMRRERVGAGRALAPGRAAQA
jgi:hypothetical protein